MLIKTFVLCGGSSRSCFVGYLQSAMPNARPTGFWFCFACFFFFGFVIFIYLFIYFFLWGLLKDLCLVFWSLNLCVIFFALEDCFLGLLATGLKAKNDSVKEREADNISPSAFNVWLNLTTCLPAFQSCMVSYWESLIFPIFFFIPGRWVKIDTHQVPCKCFEYLIGKANLPVNAVRDVSHKANECLFVDTTRSPNFIVFFHFKIKLKDLDLLAFWFHTCNNISLMLGMLFHFQP